MSSPDLGVLSEACTGLCRSPADISPHCSCSCVWGWGLAPAAGPEPALERALVTAQAQRLSHGHGNAGRRRCLVSRGICPRWSMDPILHVQGHAVIFSQLLPHGHWLWRRCEPRRAGEAALHCWLTRGYVLGGGGRGHRQERPAPQGKWAGRQPAPGALLCCGC